MPQLTGGPRKPKGFADIPAVRNTLEEWAEYGAATPEGQQMLDAFRMAIAGSIPGGIGLPARGGASGFGRIAAARPQRMTDLDQLRYHAELLKNTKLSPRGPQPNPELAEALTQLGGLPTASNLSRPGIFERAIAHSQRGRDWPGVYKGRVSEGRTRVYDNPRTYRLEE